MKNINCRNVLWKWMNKENEEKREKFYGRQSATKTRVKLHNTWELQQVLFQKYSFNEFYVLVISGYTHIIWYSVRDEMLWRYSADGIRWFCFGIQQKSRAKMSVRMWTGVRNSGIAAEWEWEWEWESAFERAYRWNFRN